jgi:hypothetical protein
MGRRSYRRPPSVPQEFPCRSPALAAATIDVLQAALFVGRAAQEVWARSSPSQLERSTARTTPIRFPRPLRLIADGIYQGESARMRGMDVDGVPGVVAIHRIRRNQHRTVHAPSPVTSAGRGERRPRDGRDGCANRRAPHRCRSQASTATRRVRCRPGAEWEAGECLGRSIVRGGCCRDRPCERSVKLTDAWLARRRCGQCELRAFFAPSTSTTSPSPCLRCA